MTDDCMCLSLPVSGDGGVWPVGQFFVFFEVASQKKNASLRYAENPKRIHPLTCVLNINIL
jgi:hypothetical protein